MQSPLWKPANVNLTESPWSPSLCYCKHFAGGDQIFIFVKLLDPQVVANESVIYGRASFWFLCLDRGKKKQAIQLFRSQITPLLDQGETTA